MTRKIRIKILSALLLVLIFSCNQIKESKDPDTVIESQYLDPDFRLITYNVWYGFTETPERKDGWIKWMQDQKPDVVSLQELNEYTPKMLAEDAAKWGHPYSVLLKEDGFPTGITAKYLIEDIHRFRENFHHGLMRVKIRDINFYIVHLHPSNWETRNREVDFIISDISSLPQDSPVILAGDFNTFSPFDSVYYSHGRLDPFFDERDKAYNEVNLREGQLDYSVISKLLDYGLIDTEYQKRPSDYKFTGSFPTLIEKEGEHGDQRRLDYVFVNKNLIDKVKRAEIIADNVTLKLSDHLPMIVDFKLE